MKKKETAVARTSGSLSAVGVKITVTQPDGSEMVYLASPKSGPAFVFWGITKVESDGTTANLIVSATRVTYAGCWST